MSPTLVACAFVVAAAAAVRSTWSPCGWSMLSSITPLSEKARGHRFRATAGWLVLGSAIGGAILGGIGAAAAAVVESFRSAIGPRVVLAVIVTLLVAALDTARIGPALPHLRRQVNERWLDQYRPWVYAMGFGAQIGLGLTTYIMTGAVYLTILLAALTAQPVTAFGLGVAFGIVRGAAVLAGRHNDLPEKLLRFHRAFDSWAEPVRRIVVAVECAVAATLVASFAKNTAITVGVAAVVAIVSLRMQRPRRTRHPEVIVIPESASLTTDTSADRRETEPTTV